MILDLRMQSAKSARSSITIYRRIFVFFTFAIVYTAIQTKNGIFTPEEAGFLDFGWIFRILNSSNISWQQAGLYDQINLIWPWAVFSKFVFALGISASWHFKILLVCRVTTLLIAINSTINKRSSGIIGTCCTLIVFTLTPIRVAPLYTHWFCHIVLACSIFHFMTTAKTSKKSILIFFSIVALTIGIWTNIPHLVAALLAIPISIVWMVVADGRGFRQIRRMIYCVLGVMVIVYAIPTAIFVFGLNDLSGVNPLLMSYFSNDGWWRVLQGFGGWWYFRQVCFGEYCVNYDSTNFELTTITLTLIRSILMLSIPFQITAYIFRRRKKISDSQTDRSIYAYILIGLPLFFLTVMGHYQIYFDLRKQFPQILGMFREPYPKFGPLFYIFLWAFIAFSLSNLVKRSHFIFLNILIILLTGCLILPIFDYPDRFDQLSQNDWATLEKDAHQILSLPTDPCIFDLSRDRNVLTYLQLKFPDKFTDLSNLRGFWRNDALVIQQKVVDRPNKCLQTDEAKALVLYSSSSNNIQADKRINLDFGNDVGNDLECLSRFEFFSILNRSCYFVLQLQNSNDGQIPGVYINFGLDRVDISKSFVDMEYAPDDLSLMYESYDSKLKSAILIVEYAHGRNRSSPIYELKVKVNSGDKIVFNRGMFAVSDPVINAMYVQQVER